MKRYLKDFALTEKTVREAVYDCMNHKRWCRKDTSYLFAEYYTKLYGTKEELPALAGILRRQAYADKTKLYPLVDYICRCMYKEITERKIDIKPIMYQIRKDHSNGKMREIGISSMKQQIYDYVAVACCNGMFMAKIGAYQCASIKGRGQLYGKTAIEKWFRTNPKKCRWIVQCDVEKYYPSVDRQILKKLLIRDIANDDVIYLLFTLLDSYKEGLCIGSYLSQFLANYLLSYAYHYLDEQCFKIRRGKRKNLLWKKLFYMDDIFLCGPDKRDLKLALKMLDEYLCTKLNLTIKDGCKLHGLDEYPTDMMGYKTGRKSTTVRKRIFDRADRLYRRYKDQSRRMSEADARSCISYYGYFKHSDSKGYIRKNKVIRTIDKAKDVVSNETKNKNDERNASLSVHGAS